MISPSQGWASTCRQSGCFYPQELQTTTNGGHTWHPIYRPVPNVFMGSPDFVSSSVGFMVETNTTTQQTHLMKTTDGGLRWSLLTSPPLMFPGTGWNAIDFVNPNRGWLLTGGQPSAGSQQKALYTTENGGVSWTLVTRSESLGSPQTPQGLPGTGYIDSLKFSNSSQGYLPLDRGPILVTHDGGRNFSPIWTQSFPPDLSMVSSLSFPSTLVGYVLTTFSGATTLWRSSQGQNTWHVIYPPLTPNGPSAFLNRQLGVGIDTIGLQPTEILRTQDGGRTWTLFKKGPPTWNTPYWGPHHTLWLLTAGNHLWCSTRTPHFVSVPVPNQGKVETLAVNPMTGALTAIIRTSQGLTAFALSSSPKMPSLLHPRWQQLGWPVSPSLVSTPSSRDIWAIGTDVTGARTLAQFQASHLGNPKAFGQYSSHIRCRSIFITLLLKGSGLVFLCPRVTASTIRLWD